MFKVMYFGTNFALKINWEPRDLKQDKSRQDGMTYVGTSHTIEILCSTDWFDWITGMLQVEDYLVILYNCLI